MTRSDQRRRQWGLAVMVSVSLGLAWPGNASADSLSDYKETKHGDSAATSDGSSDDDDGDDSGSGGFWEALSNAVNDTDDDRAGDATNESSANLESDGDGEASRADGPRACHFERFYECIQHCPDESAKCRRECRRQADWICGESAREPTVDDMTARRDDEPASAEPIGDSSGRLSGQIEAGVGGVEGGMQATTQTRMRWDTFGFGHHLSWMWNSTDDLVETDFGPAAFGRAGGFRGGVQPSVMLSFGNQAPLRVGAGVRWFVSWRGRHTLLSLSPMTGFINGRFNLHLRSAAGLRLGSRVYLKGGHDYRFVRHLANGDRSGMHGGFLALGWRL